MPDEFIGDHLEPNRWQNLPAARMLFLPMIDTFIVLRCGRMHLT